MIFQIGWRLTAGYPSDCQNLLSPDSHHCACETRSGLRDNDGKQPGSDVKAEWWDTLVGCKKQLEYFSHSGNRRKWFFGNAFGDTSIPRKGGKPGEIGCEPSLTRFDRCRSPEANRPKPKPSRLPSHSVFRACSGGGACSAPALGEPARRPNVRPIPPLFRQRRHHVATGNVERAPADHDVVSWVHMRAIERQKWRSMNSGFLSVNTTAQV